MTTGNLFDRRAHHARALSGAERLEITTNGLLILRATGVPAFIRPKIVTH